VTRRARRLLERALAGVLTRRMLPVRLRLPVRLSLRRAAGEPALLLRRWRVLRISRLRITLHGPVPRRAWPAWHAWLWRAVTGPAVAALTWESGSSVRAWRPAGEGAALRREVGARVPGSGSPAWTRSALVAVLPLASAALWPGGGAWLWLPAPSP
jgi:hypothetical protein